MPTEAATAGTEEGQANGGRAAGSLDGVDTAAPLSDGASTSLQLTLQLSAFPRIVASTVSYFPSHSEQPSLRADIAL
jgi:hypothetical protein